MSTSAFVTTPVRPAPSTPRERLLAVAGVAVRVVAGGHAAFFGVIGSGYGLLAVFAVGEGTMAASSADLLWFTGALLGLAGYVGLAVVAVLVRSAAISALCAAVVSGVVVVVAVVMQTPVVPLLLLPTGSVWLLLASCVVLVLRAGR